MSLLKLINYMSFITSLVLIVMLFSFASEIYPGPKTYPNHVHTTIYLDRNFDEFEQDQIISAAMEWTETTNHIIEFDVVQLPTHEKIDSQHGLIMVKVSPDYPDIILMDSVKGTKTLGYFEERFGLAHIALVTDRLDDFNYRKVVLHELGHSLGLEHLEGFENLDTLMYPYTNIVVDGMTLPAGSEHITLKDGRQLCRLYHCDPMKLKYQEEAFHF